MSTDQYVFVRPTLENRKNSGSAVAASLVLTRLTGSFHPETERLKEWGHG